MADAAEELPPHPAWVEAAAAVQADHDVDVRLEARGLAVAEMAQVTLPERLGALEPHTQITVHLRNGEHVTGLVGQCAVDSLVLRVPEPMVIPAHAITAASPLPRVLHEDSESASRSRILLWRGVMRDLLGEIVQLDAGGVRHTGRLTWVGADHVSVSSARTIADEWTVRWEAVDAVALPVTWQPTIEPR